MGPILREILDDDELCESSGDGLFEGSGYAVDGKLFFEFDIGYFWNYWWNYFSENDYKEPRLNEIPSDEGENSTLFDMISGKKFLAAVVSGSCVGKSSFISGHKKGHNGGYDVMGHVSTVIPVIEIDLRFAPGFNGNVSGIVSRQEGQ